MVGEERLGLPEPMDDDRVQFLREIEALYSELTAEERDELLQGLLTVAPRGRSDGEYPGDVAAGCGRPGATGGTLRAD
jgi:hypothetical protein